MATLNLKRALPTVMMFPPLLLFKFLFWRDISVMCHMTQLPRTTNKLKCNIIFGRSLLDLATDSVYNVRRPFGKRTNDLLVARDDDQ